MLTFVEAMFKDMMFEYVFVTFYTLPYPDRFRVHLLGRENYADAFRVVILNCLDSEQRVSR